jgi:hypothetical protein
MTAERLPQRASFVADGVAADSFCFRFCFRFGFRLTRRRSLVATPASP